MLLQVQVAERPDALLVGRLEQEIVGATELVERRAGKRLELADDRQLGVDGAAEVERGADVVRRLERHPDHAEDHALDAVPLRRRSGREDAGIRHRAIEVAPAIRLGAALDAEPHRVTARRRRERAELLGHRFGTGEERERHADVLAIRGEERAGVARVVEELLVPELEEVDVVAVPQARELRDQRLGLTLPQEPALAAVQIEQRRVRAIRAAIGTAPAAQHGHRHEVHRLDGIRLQVADRAVAFEERVVGKRQAREIAHERRRRAHDRAAALLPQSVDWRVAAGLDAPYQIDERLLAVAGADEVDRGLGERAGGIDDPLIAADDDRHVRQRRLQRPQMRDRRQPRRPHRRHRDQTRPEPARNPHRLRDRVMRKNRQQMTPHSGKRFLDRSRQRRQPQRVDRLALVENEQHAEARIVDRPNRGGALGGLFSLTPARPRRTHQHPRPQTNDGAGSFSRGLRRRSPQVVSQFEV